MGGRLQLEIHGQPDDSSCGPACLQALYAFYGDKVPLDRLIQEVEPLETGGTLAVMLAVHALRRNYRATLYTYNLQLFDPTWFNPEGDHLAERLERQAAEKEDAKLRVATSAYVEYLALGGMVRFEELSPELIRFHLNRDRPILTGLSATYLFGCARERGWESLEFDDVRGYPTGHFVVLYGHDPATGTVRVADPLQDNPRYGSHYYEVGMQRLLGAILLGVLTYDANLLILEPRSGPKL